MNGTRPSSPQEGHGWAGAGSEVYLFGGSGGSNGQDGELLDALWAFSTKNASWAQLAAGPSSRHNSCFGSSGGLLYLLGGISWDQDQYGGRDYNGHFWSYNPADNVWIQRTHNVTLEGSSPWPRYGGALLDVAGALLLVHGSPNGILLSLSPHLHLSLSLSLTL